MNKKIGYIGLGNMGQGMAINIAKGGFDLTVYDLNHELTQSLQTLGAKVATSNKEVGEICDIIEICVVNDKQVEQVVFGTDKDAGVLAGARPGSLIVVHSTVHPKTCERIAAAAQEKGLDAIDAAVSGAEAGSASGTLTLMIGGPPEHLETCRPIFEAVGANVFHMGDVGRGQVAKLCNNLMSIINLVTVEEGLRLAEAAGIDEKQMIEIASVSTGNSWALHGFGPMRDLLKKALGDEGSMALIARKDVALAVDLARSLEVPVPVAEFVVDLGGNPKKS